ncbi:SemiSWEET family transporter [Spiroplasma endosymbiont of Ammophila pubescens]|uniref:SemiSWEET family transporter n=1 Tax=Spiroplasma endosymbiont of Ammophila pubescens TaxID=3066315 RepID=UPI0032B216C8
MTTYEIIGLVGTSLTSIYLIPQSIKTIIKRNTKGISLLMYLLLITASLVWICYAVISPEINYQIAVTNILQAFFRYYYLYN